MPVVTPALSKRSAQWDVDGDGQLDAAEKQLRDQFPNGPAEITPEQLHAMAWKGIWSKRASVVFACGMVALFLISLGSTWTAVSLTRQMQTNNGGLVDSKTGEVLATQSAVDRFELGPQADTRRRLCSEDGTDCEYDADELNDGLLVAASDADLIVKYCKAGHTVSLTASTRTFTVCAPGLGEEERESKTKDGVTYMRVKDNTIRFQLEPYLPKPENRFIFGLSAKVGAPSSCQVNADCLPKHVCTSVAKGTACLSEAEGDSSSYRLPPSLGR